MKILYAASEATPFAKSGGLADVAGSLPKALVKDGVDARVIMPLYGDLKMRDKLEYVTNYSVPVGWRSQYCGLFKAEVNGVTYYFLDNEYYFKRRGLYGFYDDGERFAFFSRAVLETLFYIDFTPDIINCNDWQTALVPVYLNLYYRHLDKFNRIKTIFTIHNIAYQGKYGTDILEDTCGIGHRDQHIVEYDGCANFMKGAFETADKITTVSPTYAQEILDPWFSYGLDALLREKQYKLCGILNGIDMEANNPATDPKIPFNYDVTNFEEGKAKCKEALQNKFGLHKDGSPVFAMVSRMVGMKGFDLVQSVADGLVDRGIELVILGSGDIGMIMARRMTLEGAKVLACVEVMPYSGGLKRNIVQCLDDFGIPLKLSTTVVKIHGKERVEGVTLAKVDGHMKPIPGTEEYIPCDTLLLSVGLLPENELTEELGAKMSPVTRGPLVNESMETSLSGVFACGNVLHVHDLVDFVSQEAALAGNAAAEWLKENRDKVTEADVILEQAEVKAETSGAAADTKRPAITVETGAHVRYTVPSKIRPDKAGEETLIRFRVDSVLKDHYLCVSYDGELISHKKKRIMAPGEMEQAIGAGSGGSKRSPASRTAAWPS